MLPQWPSMWQWHTLQTNVSYGCEVCFWHHEAGDMVIKVLQGLLHQLLWGLVGV